MARSTEEDTRSARKLDDEDYKDPIDLLPKMLRSGRDGSDVRLEGGGGWFVPEGLADPRSTSGSPTSAE